MGDHLALQQIERKAEREMATFVRAMAGNVDNEQAQQAGESWLRMMCSLAWPTDNHERFFRRVAILAMSQLLQGMHESSSGALSCVHPFSK